MYMKDETKQNIVIHIIKKHRPQILTYFQVWNLNKMFNNICAFLSLSNAKTTIIVSQSRRQDIQTKETSGMLSASHNRAKAKKTSNYILQVNFKS